MSVFWIWLGVMAAIVAGVSVHLIRRERTTVNAEGLRVEQAAREQAHDDRVTYGLSYDAFTVPPPRRDLYRR